MKTVRSLLLFYVSSFAKPLLLTFSVSIIGSLVTILIPLSLGKYYALVFESKGGRQDLFQIIPDESLDSVPQFLFAFGILLMLKLGFGYYQRYLIASVVERMVNQIRLDLFDYQLGVNMTVYDEKGIGKYLLRYSGDLKSIQNYISKGIIGFTVDLGMLIIALVFLVYIHLQMAVIAICSVPLIAIPIILLNKRINFISEQRRNRRSNLLSFVNKRLMSITTVKAFNRHHPEHLKFRKRSELLLREGLKYHQLTSMVYILIPVLLYAMLGLIMYLTYRLKNSGIDLDQAGALAAFFLILSMLPVLRRILKVTVIWKLGKISLRKLVLIFNLPNNFQNAEKDLDLNNKTISLESLSFDFANKTVINQLDLKWEGRGIHLVNGNMGAGKSTLLKLILGIYSPTKGKIIIDGQSISTVNVKSLRKNITVVSSDFPLLGRSVFEAISYSRKKTKRKRAQKVLLKLQAYLPADEQMQLDDAIAYGGSNLSKGQEMILLFARALLTNKDIILLDEPFKNLDRRMRNHIIKLLNEIQTEKMILFFTKRSILKQLKVATYSSLEENLVQKLSA